MKKILSILIATLFFLPLINEVYAVDTVTIPGDSVFTTVRSLTGTGTTCPAVDTTYLDNPTFRWILPSSQDSTSHCYRSASEYDISGIHPATTILDVKVSITVHSSLGSADCEWTHLNNQPSTSTASDLWADIDDGTIFKDDGNCRNTGTYTLGPNAVADLQEHVSNSEGWWGFGFNVSDETRGSGVMSVQHLTDPTLIIEIPDPVIPVGSSLIQGEVVGDVVVLNSELTLSSGFPPPDVTTLEFFKDTVLFHTENLTGEEAISGVSRTFDDYKQFEFLTDDVSHDYKITTTVTNTAGTTIIESNEVTLSRQYVPEYTEAQNNIGLMNYTTFRTNNDQDVNITINRDLSGGLFDVDCNWVNQVDALSDLSNGVWLNHTNAAAVHDIMTFGSGETVYITCFENDVRMFVAVSYGNVSNFLAGGTAIFDSIGGFFGAPPALMIVLGIFAMATNRNAPTMLIIGLSVAGILGSVGLLFFEPAIWGALLVLGALGVFGVKKFF